MDVYLLIKVGCNKLSDDISADAEYDQIDSVAS